MEPLPQYRGDDADNHAGEDAVGPVDGGFEPGRVFVEALEGLHLRDRSERLHDRVEHDEADDGSQTRRSVALAGETDGDTDREQQWQPVEQTAARCGEDLADLFCRPPAAEQVVLSEPE